MLHVCDSSKGRDPNQTLLIELGSRPDQEATMYFALTQAWKELLTGPGGSWEAQTWPLQ